MKYLLLFFLSLACFPAISQQVHTVTDPDIQFSLEVPEGWRVEDDGYTIYLVPLQGGTENVDFTYFETEETSVERTLEFNLNAFNDPEVREFEVLTQSKEEIDGVMATKVEASLKMKGVPYKRLVYLFIKDGQFYILRGHSFPENFSRFKPVFETIARSLKTEKR